MDTKLKAEQAFEALNFRKDGNRKLVHSFQGFGPILMGCDISITSIREKFKKAKSNEIQIAGKNMSNMGHCVAIWEEDRGWLFLETKPWFTKTAQILNKKATRKPPVY